MLHQHPSAHLVVVFGACSSINYSPVASGPGGLSSSCTGVVPPRHDVTWYLCVGPLTWLVHLSFAPVGSIVIHQPDDISYRARWVRKQTKVNRKWGDGIKKCVEDAETNQNSPLSLSWGEDWHGMKMVVALCFNLRPKVKAGWCHLPQ